MVKIASSLSSLSKAKNKEQFLNDIFAELSKLYKKDHFDKYGLKWDNFFLDYVGLMVSFLPVELAAEFADEITTNMERHPKNIRDIVGSFKLAIKTFDNIKKDLNATSVGNLAYLIVNSNDDELTQLGKELLLKIRKDTKIDILTTLNDIL